MEGVNLGKYNPTNSSKVLCLKKTDDCYEKEEFTFKQGKAHF